MPEPKGPAPARGSGPGDAAVEVRLIRQAGGVADLVDWGPIPPARGGAAALVSRTRGLLLHKGEGGRPEAGVWECTPGLWDCRVERDEFCYFLSGRSVYTHASGRRTEIGAGDAAWFPAGWSGVCEVLETVRKVYVIR